MRRRLLFALLLPVLAHAQTITVDTVRIGQARLGGPATFCADPIERAMIAGTFTAPAQGDTSWAILTADDEGWIRDERLARGYAFATVTVPEDGVWILEAMGYSGVYVNGEPRVGNIYGYTDEWEPWQPAFDWSRVPVKLQAGENEFLFYGSRFGLLRARLERATAPLALNVDDVTRPDLVVGQSSDTWAALPVINATDELVTDAELVVTLHGNPPVRVTVPPLPPLGVRKVGVPVRGAVEPSDGQRTLHFELRRHGQLLATDKTILDVRQPLNNRRVTFRSELDGSIQYYGLLPARGDDGAKALVLSLHGAAVEAFNQSGSYAALNWGHVVAPTNRRAYGFNWEDWGRRDALEALAHARANLDTDPDRTYLTGHSMGGHGAWHLATIRPDLFAAVGPSAGWVSFWSYRPDRVGGESSPLVAMLGRATSPSRTLDNAPNLEGLGVYVLHGDDDQVVSVNEARTMRERLADFHRDVDWHEEPGAGHWWDLSDGPGADCVAWAPMFDFFTRHRRPRSHEVRAVRFITPNPAVSSQRHWVTVAQQQRPFIPSRVDISLDPLTGRLGGVTENVARMALDVAHVEVDTLTVALDGDTLRAPVDADAAVWLHRGEHWRVAGPTPVRERGVRRGGGFRAAFDHRVQLIYGTRGTAEETALALAHARHDAEHLWYQGNGAMDVLPDTVFVPDAEPDRNVILYGNADTHRHWHALWIDPAVTVQTGELRVGDRVLAGDDLGLLALRPRPGSEVASVGVMASTGLAGQRLLQRRPYLRPAVAYPDLTVFQDLGDGTVVRGAGFFSNRWTLEGGEFAWVER